MRIASLYRFVLLAPFGGEARLLSNAIRRVGLRERPVHLYAGDRLQSIENRVAGRSAVIVSLALAPISDERTRFLRDVVFSAAPGCEVVILDNNAPRGRLVRGLAAAYVALAWPVSRSRPSLRLRHSVARELHGLGMDVVSLRLLAGEVFQAVLARKPTSG